MNLENLSQYFDDKVKASLAIAQLAQLGEYGPGKALLELAKGIEAKLLKQMRDNPNFDMSEPKKHNLYLLGILKGLELMTQQAPELAKAIVDKAE